MSQYQLDLSDDLTADQRAAAERSVAALASRAEKSFELRRQQAQEEAALRARINAPLARIIEADDDAAKAAADLKSMQERWAVKKSYDVVWPQLRPADVQARLAGDGVADEVYVLPFHYSWQWHHDSAPDVSTVDRSTGNIQVGSMVIGGQDRTGIHAGFGVGLSTTVERMVSVRSLRRTHHRYLVSAGVVGGVALTEGGTEMTVFEDGRLLPPVSDKRWRKRVSNGESESDDSGGFATGEPYEITFKIVPGRSYTFNVGAWTFIEKEDGFGFSGFSTAQAVLDAQVLAMTVFHN